MANEDDADTGVSFVSVELGLVWSTLLLVTLIAYKTSWRPMGRYCPSGTTALLLGAATGLVVRFLSPQLTARLRFQPEFFFFALLPPIIFNAGFSLKKRAFFENFAAIVLFALVGTIISSAVFGMGTFWLMQLGAISKDSIGSLPAIRCLMYGTLISSIDPVATLAVFRSVGVPPLLYNLVFGESVINDAATIILFETIRNGYHVSKHHIAEGTSPSLGITLVLGLLQNSVASLLVGLLVSLAIARVLKGLSASRAAMGDAEASVHDVIVIITGSYLSYVIATGMGLSGIIAVFISGIIHSHYSLHSLAPTATATLPLLFEPLATIAELFTFVYMGFQPFVGDLRWDWGLIASAVPLGLLARAANIVPLTATLRGLCGVSVPWKVQVMQILSGARGCMAYALVINMPSIKSEGLANESGNPYLEAATLFLVMATTIVGGAATAPALHMLDLDCDGAMDDVASECPSAGEYSQLGSTQERGPHVWSARTMWRHMDSMFLKPIFGGRSSLERGGEQGESVGGGSGENGGGGGWWGGGRGAE